MQPGTHVFSVYELVMADRRQVGVVVGTYVGYVCVMSFDECRLCKCLTITFVFVLSYADCRQDR